MSAAASTKLLIAIPEAESAQDVFTKKNGLQPFVAAIRAETEGRVFDMSTAKGRGECASLAYAVTRSKTALDDVGKQVVAKLKELPKLIDANRKAMREELEALAEDIRRPVTEWEAAEKARIAKLEADIASLKDTSTEGMDADAIRAKLAALEAVVIDAGWQEYETEAHRAKACSVERLREKLDAREQFERDQAELAELRRLKAEEEARRAVEPEPEEVSAADMLTQAAAPASAEFDESADLAALGGYLAPAAASAAPASQPARITGNTNIAHALSVLTAAKDALMNEAGLSEEQARTVINLIRQGKVPAVSISYGE